MRVFVFGIGGTGARVITQLVMHLAAGVRPVGEDGKVLKGDFSIVPILIDPHSQCEALVNLSELLNDYRTIHKRLYGEIEDPGKGFFSVKIQTMHDIASNDVSHDDFTFRLPNVSNNKFKDYIGCSDMSSSNRNFMEFLFSKNERETDMAEGFYGSPNIGCVALNSFVDSPDFAAFKKIVNGKDKAFFIGSIFGGTGASGLPLFISNIRYLITSNQVDSQNCGKIPIGALIVMPYFKISDDEQSPINDSDFMIKTRSALSYYETNMNKRINNVYYIADQADKSPIPFENDPGNKDNQKGNKAHLVEFMGAASLLDFIKSNNVEMKNDGTDEVLTTKFLAYGIDSDDDNIEKISFREFGTGMKEALVLPYMKFYITKYWMKHYLPDDGGKPYAKDNPKIDPSIANSPELNRIFRKFDMLMEQMNSHGSAAHNLKLFNDILGDNFIGAFCNIEKNKSGLLKFGRKSLDRSSILDCLNKAGDELKNSGITGEQKWFMIANDEALDKLIKSNLNLSNLGI